MKCEKIKLFTDFRKFLCRDEGEAFGLRVSENAEKRWKDLCEENIGDTKAVKAHTEQKIFPAVAFFYALIDEGKTREQARQIIYDYCAENALPERESMIKMCRIPGVARHMPFFWKLVTKNQFGPEAGFEFRFYDMGSKRVKFDMLQCPYFEICKRYGCPEIVTAFCHTDDVKNGGIHPRLNWARTQTIGEGAKLCDFDLIVEDKK